MEKVGISSSKQAKDTAIRVILGMGAESLSFLIKREKIGRWSVQIKVRKEGFNKIYFFEKQRGGARLFNHLDDAIFFAMERAPNIKKFEIVFDTTKLKATKMKVTLGE